MKDLKISTELASAVLGKEVTKCSLISTARSSINITMMYLKLLKNLKVQIKI